MRSIEDIIKVLRTTKPAEFPLTVDPSTPDWQAIMSPKNRLAMTQAGFVSRPDASGASGSWQIFFKDEAKARANDSARTAAIRHEFVKPQAYDNLEKILKDEQSHVIWLKGPTGCGKTVTVDYAAKTLGYEKFQVNCREDMGPEHFIGARTVVIDDETKQNKIVFNAGPVVKAMQAGLDKDGNEIPGAKPGLLFIDEAGAMPSAVAIALNRLLESDNPVRRITIDEDGGREVKSHSKFRIVLAANTAGRGALNMSESLYTAQMNALDISVLNRISFTLLFGYDRKVENEIVFSKIPDGQVCQKLLSFRDAIRQSIKKEKLTTPFSTRTLVKISDAHRIFNNLKDAIRLTVFETILDEEKTVYNEKMRAIGIGEISMAGDNDIDYM